MFRTANTSTATTANTKANTTANTTACRMACTNAMVSKIVLMLCLLLVVSACGKKRTVVTQDDSADYHSARALPPLRKVGVSQAQPEAAPQSSPQADQQLGSVPSDALLESPAPELSAPQVLSPKVDAPQVVVTDRSSELESVELEPNVNKASKRDRKKQASSITAKVIDKGEKARLSLDQPFEAAWIYISDNLKGSDVTVHNRNEVAGRFSIGCSNLDAEQEEAKAGGWSIFKKKEQDLEYCALQLIGKKKTTEVSVLNRSGLEVESAAAKTVFSRLLNN